jgi:hypothetical protein
MGHGLEWYIADGVIRSGEEVFSSYSTLMLLVRDTPLLLVRRSEVRGVRDGTRVVPAEPMVGDLGEAVGGAEEAVLVEAEGVGKREGCKK